MKRASQVYALSIGAALLLTTTAHAGPPKDPPTKCAPDAVLVGPTCMDTYEASVWFIPAQVGGKSNKGLIKKVRKGKATKADLIAGSAFQLGTVSDNYAPCLDHGEACNHIYAVSLPTVVVPSANITWFQASIACANAGKRLPTNDEWQAAVTGTPNSALDNGTTDCNTSGVETAPIGSRSGCVSEFGAYDMMGNVSEWVANWMPRSTACGTWAGSDDAQCLAGADTTGGEPGALLRGGDYNDGAAAGPLAVSGSDGPSSSSDGIGFRCAR